MAMGNSNSHQRNLKGWITRSIRPSSKGNDGIDKSSLFTIGIWWIRRWRNNIIFRKEEMDPNRKGAWILEAEKEINRAFRRQHAMNSETDTRKLENLFWKPSADHEWTLNVDASVKHTTQQSSYEGVLRRKNSEWVGNFCGKSRHEDVAIVEAEAIARGLAWAWKAGFIDVKIQSDVERVINWISGGMELRGPICEHIDEIERWLQRN
ncbi:PREDICTED: uncharacterized protein LOC109191381 [Ipomoea nil]|uniref:uncharacterized protein LOC109191381 n=1 Tax=Ipomoea nil TaxID=35883 RepID=UPI0009015504|nr:PREDICTED: uncharacterized protein LOC109191381 [Ipomoea nil]